MKDLVVTVNGIRFKVRNLDEKFAAYVEGILEESGIHPKRDNAADKLFNAFLHLAAQSYNYEKEIDEILKDDPGE
jgi:hypothetical protein